MKLRTPRLVLRSWRNLDLLPFATMNADTEVRCWFPNVLTRRESDDQAARLRLQDEERGFTFWAVELPGAAPFIGFVGLLVVRFPALFTPAVEIGWRRGRLSDPKRPACPTALATTDWWAPLPDRDATDRSLVWPEIGS